MHSWLRVFEALQLAEVYLARDWLEDHGVRTQIRGEALIGIGGAIPVPDALPSVWVPSWQLDQAREALEGFDQAGANPEPAWRCVCGSDNDGHFASCWQCRQDKPGIPPHVL